MLYYILIIVSFQAAYQVSQNPHEPFVTMRCEFVSKQTKWRLVTKNRASYHNTLLNHIFYTVCCTVKK